MTDGSLQLCRRWNVKLAVRKRYGILDVLVDKSADVRDAVVQILLWKELVGASGGRS